jgi:glycosyltransferase involved in cell wall biosynthesis
VKIDFLVHTLYNIGGTIRTTLNTAAALADRGHDVRIVSVFRRRDKTVFPIDSRVATTNLIDERFQAADADAADLLSADAELAARPSKIFPPTEPRAQQYHRLADVRVERYLRGTDADVIVGTRPGLNIYIGKFAPSRAVIVAQEHLALDHHGRRLIRRLYKMYKKFDAVTTVSEADARDYRRAMPRIASRVSHIPNSVPPTPLDPSDGMSKLIVAAGRLEEVKRYDLLLRAFAKVHRLHPDWRLRIYGHGNHYAALKALMRELRLHNCARMMGTYAPIDTEWAKGAIAAVTSDFEAFGLTIVEAMDCGVPVVATDCPQGPAEIISSGVDGLLTRPGDVDAYAEALVALIEDDETRVRMGRAARETARRYHPDRVASEYLELFERLLAAKGRATAVPGEPRRSQVDDAVSCVSHSFSDITLMLPHKESVTLVRGNRSIPVGAELDAEALSALDEGVWAVHVDGAAARADRVDSRELLRRPATVPPTIAVPFADQGELAIRVWRREVLAEFDSADWDGATLTVAGTLLGASPSEATADLRARGGAGEDVKVGLGITDGRFSLTVDAARLAESARSEPTFWNLWLTLDGRLVRVGRMLDDIAQRKDLERLPPWYAGSGPYRRVHPYFSAHNELSIKVSVETAYDL